MAISLWNEMINNFIEKLDSAIEKLQERDIENIPGAKDRLIDKFNQLKNYLPRENGEILIKIIDNKIQDSFFPRTNNLSEAFLKILESRTPEQDYIISELINGFISSKGKSIASEKEGSILDHLVEAFKKRRDFRIIDYQFYAMYGNPDKVRKGIKKRLNDVVEFLGLESEVVIHEDVKDGIEKEYVLYSFPAEITEILDGKYIDTLENGDKIITEKFDKMVFISYFLAKLSINRKESNNYTINGICAIFSLIFIVGLMPKISLDEKNPINRDPHYDPNTMSVIPKSWMTKDILSELLPPLIQLIAFRLGGNNWLEKIALTEERIKMHLQAQFLLKDVNKWVLGNMTRVEIPIFVEISSIFAEVLVGSEREE